MTASAGSWPPTVSPAAALRLLGLRDRYHPRDVLAFAYRDQAEAARWRAAYEQHKLPWLGDMVTDMGIIGLVDCRPAMAAKRGPVDPALPDDYLPPADLPPREG